MSHHHSINAVHAHVQSTATPITPYPLMADSSPHGHGAAQSHSHSREDAPSALSALLRDACALQSVFHGGALNVTLLTLLSVTVAGFAHTARARGAIRIGLAVVSAAILVFAIGYALCVSRWHRDASIVLHACLETEDRVLPPAASRAVSDMVSRSWEARERTFAVIGAVLLVAVLMAVFPRKSATDA